MKARFCSKLKEQEESETFEIIVLRQPHPALHVKEMPGMPRDVRQVDWERAFKAKPLTP